LKQGDQIGRILFFGGNCVCLLWADLKKCTEVAKNSTFYHAKSRFGKNGLGFILGDFFENSVTLLPWSLSY
jgi:hypothetical protein